MLSHSGWWLLVDSLATFRLAMLVAKDSITAPAREWLRSQGWEVDVHSGLPMKRRGIGSAISRTTHEWAACPWCNSPWCAAGIVILQANTSWAIWVIYILALSAITGILAEHV